MKSAEFGMFPCHNTLFGDESQLQKKVLPPYERLRRRS